jgi:NIMA (never in mitosis gene a)-related kinase
MKNFEIINKLGNGAYSEVFKVRRKADNKIYALKKVKLKNLKEKEKQNSLNEIRILASIKSPFVISYKEAFFTEEDKTLNLVMEYADSGDLYQKIKHYKKYKLFFEEKDIWKIFIQITRGLKSLHNLNILHRDFKSANIFLFSTGEAKIGDLNVSKIMNKGLGNTQTGTPYYASPEVWNNSPYDCKSDIWSLGCILYEMLTLNPPFNADDFEGLYKKVMAGKYNKINSRYSEDMNELLKLLFKIDPKERPNCDEILKLDFIRKRIDFFKAEAGLDFNSIDTMDDNELLKTIRLSKNLVGLKDKLPKPNYSLPKINMNNLTKTKFNNDLQKEVLTTTNNTNLTKNMDTFNIKTKPYNDMITLKKIRINSEQRYLNEKNEKNKYKDLYNLYTVSRSKNNNIYKIKKNEEKKNVGINNRKSNNNDKKIFDTYKLYLSKEMRKFLSKNKKYRLPNINVNKNSQNLLLNKK